MKESITSLPKNHEVIISILDILALAMLLPLKTNNSLSRPGPWKKNRLNGLFSLLHM